MTARQRLMAMALKLDEQSQEAAWHANSVRAVLAACSDEALESIVEQLEREGIFEPVAAVPNAKGGQA